MLYKAKVGVCCNINTIHINTVWAECRIFECLNCCCIKQTLGFKRLNIMSVCLYPCPSYPACKSHFSCAALYCHLRPVYLCHIIPSYFINGMIVERKLLDIKCVFWFSLQPLSEKCITTIIIQQDVITYVHRSSRKIPVTLVRFQSNVNFLDTFSKYPEYQIS
jgi:hypothetical protein